MWYGVCHGVSVAESLDIGACVLFRAPYSIFSWHVVVRFNARIIIFWGSKPLNIYVSASFNDSHLSPPFHKNSCAGPVSKSGLLSIFFAFSNLDSSATSTGLLLNFYTMLVGLYPNSVHCGQRHSGNSSFPQDSVSSSLHVQRSSH